VTVGSGFQLWIEERDKAVWHLSKDPSGRGRFEVACGWKMTKNDRRIYPKKANEPGPPEAQRCHSCVGGYPDLRNRPASGPYDSE
jgi:hypothetical protein